MYCSFSSEGKPLMGNCCCIRSKRPNSWNLYTKSEETALAKRCEKSSSITSNLTQATSGKNSRRSLPAQRSSGDLIYSPHLKAFAYRELVAATRNFCPESLIGEGGFGCVYKGWMDGNTLEATMPGSGVMVAVKKLRPHGFQGHKEWLCELNYLGQLHHPNLVELIGFCLEGDNKLLVYEYMVNGSLENHLFKRYDGTLSWARRIKVAIGAAKGLAFLHELGQPVIYRDFKASNILLDLEFNSKLSDFGLAKAGPTGDRSHVSTQVLGTQGYAAPEYIATGRLTARCDVYSFGVVLLELLSGRPAVDKTKGGGERFLVEWARPFLGDKRKLFRIMDTKLEGQYPQKEAQALAMLALQCLDEVKVRPQMPQVLAVLESISIGNKDHARSSPHHESSTIDSHSTSNSPSLMGPSASSMLPYLKSPRLH